MQSLSFLELALLLSSSSDRALAPPSLVPLCSYIEFSGIAAKCVRSALKTTDNVVVEAAAKRSTGVAQVKHFTNGVAGTPSTLGPCVLQCLSLHTAAHHTAAHHNRGSVNDVTGARMLSIKPTHLLTRLPPQCPALPLFPPPFAEVYPAAGSA